ncbi:MAG TPA: hypothetical protein VIL69_13760 [Roseomonas sp.]|jgi:hypothetical protein
MRFSSHNNRSGYAPRPGVACLDQPGQISKLIAALDGTGHAFALPLYRAALAGELAMAALLPGGRVPTRLLDHTRPPTVIVVSGDPANPTEAASPPEAFPQARRLLAWSASVMLHATGGKEAHYRAVVAGAKAWRRVLLIETATSQEDAWLALVEAERERRLASGRVFPAVCISARPRGGVHPVWGTQA